LSEAEASIAAPFTSKVPNISPIVMLLKEGRASLVTCFTVFKFMAVYSMIQFISVIILYQIVSNLGNYQFLYIDLFLVTPLSLTMSRTGAHNKLSKGMPIGYLISAPVLLSVMFQAAIQAGFQLSIFFYLKSQSWFIPLVPEGDFNIESQENTTLFFMSLAQYLLIVVVFSVGKPFRKAMFTNYWLLGSLIVFSTISLLVILVPPAFITDIMQLVDVPFEWRLIIVGAAAANLLISYVFEKVLICIHMKVSAG
jgi:cation-transporting P-type ATPase 13A2